MLLDWKMIIKGRKMKVFIPTAGIGSRLYPLTKYLNKCLVSVDNRPVISHIIEQYPDDTQFVIALGYKGNLIKDFLELAYTEKRFIFVKIDKYEGEGSGLGYTFLKCKEHLQEPFIFNSCDTLVNKNIIPEPDENWIGYKIIPFSNQYRTLDIKEEQIIDIHEKGEWIKCESNSYIGLSGIHDYKEFWEAMEYNNEEIITKGEVFGLNILLLKGIKAYEFEWCDTGNPKSLAFTRKVYQTPNSPNILEKSDEAIWFVNNKVIKFSNDKKFIENRVKRAKLIEGYVPKILDSRSNMYSYKKVEGEILSKIVTIPLFDKLLNYSEKFWEYRFMLILKYKEFDDNCLKFYKNKTEERIELFYKTHEIEDKKEYINGIYTPTLKELLNNINWKWLSDAFPVRFHGDFHFENILYSNNKFTFLDWRQDFGGDLEVGDIYYDFAKLNHGLIICHELIAKNMFHVDINEDNIHYDFYRKQILVECEQYFKEWIKKNGHDYKKIRMLTALIFLNIAPLHHDPYSKLLYYLGKSILYEELK